MKVKDIKEDKKDWLVIENFHERYSFETNLSVFHNIDLLDLIRKYFKIEINLEDEIFRSLAILSSARVITNSELMKCLSNVKLGIEMGYIQDVSLEKITKLMTGRHPYLKIISAYDEEDKIERATYIRREFSLANRNNK